MELTKASSPEIINFMKQCSICRKPQDVSNFYRSGKGALHSYCKVCFKMKRRNGKPEFVPIFGKGLHKNDLTEYHKKYHLKRKYGLTTSEWEEIFEAQDRCCAICKRKNPDGKHWHTDHCHTTGKVRGILCHSCNHLLGKAFDNIDTLLNAAEYLRKAR